MPLYQCPVCGHEFEMDSQGDRIFCRACGSAWEMDEYGNLMEVKNTRGEAPLGTNVKIPDWYEWERENVDREIREGRYRLDCSVRVEALPNSVNFIDCGEGRLVHEKTGFGLSFRDYRDGQQRTLHFPSASMTSIHTEYDYRGKGQCVVLSVPDDTYFLFPLEKKFNATKIQFAVEYLYCSRSHF